MIRAKETGNVGSPTFLLWMLAVMLGVLLAAPAAITPLFDTAYIHARLAENLLQWGAPYFNEGQAHKTGSATGYVLLIAAASTLLEPLQAIRAIQLVTLFLLVLGLAALIITARSGYFAKTVIAVSSLPLVLVAGYGGMETPLVCLLLVLAALAFQFRRDALVVLLVALCPWFRLESLLLLGLVLFYYVHVRHNSRLLLYAFPLLILLVIENRFFSTLLLSYSGASSTLYGYPFLESAARALQLGYTGVGGVVGVLLFSVLLYRLFRVTSNRGRLRFADIYFVFAAGVFVAWLVSGVIMQPWHYCVFAFPFALGLVLEAQKSGGGTARSEALWLTVPQWLVLLGLFALGVRSVLLTFDPLAERLPAERIKRYQQIGAVLYAHCPSCSVAGPEVGALGFDFKGRVYDGFGRADPAALKFHPLDVPAERQSHEVVAIPPAYVGYRQPDFVVATPRLSAAFGLSAEARPYTRYECLLAVSKPEANNAMASSSALSDAMVIRLFSKTPLPLEKLREMGCAE